MTDVRALPRVATIATIAGRQEYFEQVLRAIVPQVSRVFVYLDGYGEIPEFVRDYASVTACRAEDVGDLHCSSRYLCVRELQAPTLLASVDDDIAYPGDYVAMLAEALHQLGPDMVVGVHGRSFLPPHESYARHAHSHHFSAALASARHVHELGMGTSAFVTDRLPVDPRTWERTDMDDIVMAIEAQRRGLPRVVIPRREGWLTPLLRAGADSLWARTLRDDTEQTRRMRELLALYSI